MRLKFYISIIVTGFLFGCIPSLQAQNNQVIHLNNNVYTYIKNLQLRGYLPELSPTSLPYTRSEIDKSLRKIDEQELSRVEQFWYGQIKDEVAIPEPDSEKLYMYGMIEGGFDLNNTLENDGLRPQADKLFFQPNGASNLYGEQGNFGAQLGLRHNLFYFQDRRGLDVLTRYYVRSEDYYIGYQGEFLKAYMGRYDSHWAPYGEASTVISTNPRSFDRLDITLGNSWFEVSGLFAELDNLGKDGTFERNGKNLINGTKRFLALHRIDIKVTDGLRLGYFDGFIYSSEHSIASMKYITPVNVFFFDRNTNPLNDEFNAFFGGMVWWHHRNMTMNLQIMIDDIVIKSGQLRSDIEPTTFAVTNSFNFSNITDNIDAGYEAEVVSYQTYNTDQAEGRYLFLQRGIATQFTDYAYLSGYLNIHAHTLLKGLTVKPRLSFLAQGEQEINQPFTDEYENGEIIDVILTGTEEKTSRISIDLLYNPIPEFWVDAKLGYNYLTDKHHIPGNSDSRFTGTLVAGFRLNIDSYTFK